MRLESLVEIEGLTKGKIYEGQCMAVKYQPDPETPPKEMILALVYTDQNRWMHYDINAFAPASSIDFRGALEKAGLQL